MALRPVSPGLFHIHADCTCLSQFQFSSIMHKCLSAFSLSPTDYSIHSFCIDAATEAFEVGLPPEKIRPIRHWCSTAYQVYICCQPYWVFICLFLGPAGLFGLEGAASFFGLENTPPSSGWGGTLGLDDCLQIYWVGNRGMHWASLLDSTPLMFSTMALLTQSSFSWQKIIYQLKKVCYCCTPSLQIFRSLLYACQT